MLRITSLLFRPSGVGISPFSMFLINNKGRRVKGTAVSRYNALSSAQKLQLKQQAIQHPSFKKSKYLVYIDFIRKRFPKLEGRAYTRMRKIGVEWQHRKAKEAAQR
jgi:hypothetical protein